VSKEYEIVMDSGGDVIRPEHEKYMVVPMNITVGDETFVYPGDKTKEELLRELEQRKPGEMRTSQPSPKQIMAAIESLGVDEVIYITLSSGLSGTFNSAVIASRLLERKGIMLHLVDSKSASLVMGLLLAKGLELRDAGKSAEEVVMELNRLVPKYRAMLAVPTLDYLVAGGRLDPFKAALAKIVGIRPILEINEDGRIDVAETVRAKHIWKHFANYLADKTYLAYGPAAKDDIQQVKKFLAEQGKMVVEETFISPVLAVHTGPGIVGGLAIREKV
jgi:DegV family protein with EDD domain